MKTNRLVLYLLLGVLPLAYHPGSTSFSGFKLIVLLFVVGLWLISWGWSMSKNRPCARIDYPILITGLAWLLLAGTARLFSPYTGLLGTATLTGVLWLTVVYLVRQTLTDSSTRIVALTILSASSSLAALFGLTQMAGLLPGAPPESGYPPGISTLGNQNYLAGLAAVLFWPSFSLWSEKERKPGQPLKQWAWLMTIVLGLTVAFSRTTGAQLATIFTGLVFVPMGFWQHRQKLISAGRYFGSTLSLGTLFLLISMTIIVPGRQGGEARWVSPLTQSSLAAKNSGDVRLANWMIARSMAEDNLLLGVGPGGFQAGWISTREKLATTDLDSIFPNRLPAAMWAHNDILQWIAETGLVGLALCLVCLILFFQSWNLRFQSLTNRRQQRDFLFITMGPVTASLHGWVSFPLHLPVTTLAVCFLATTLFSDTWFNQQQIPSSKPTRVWIRAVVIGLGLIAMVTGFITLQGDLALARAHREYQAGNWKEAITLYSRGMGISPPRPDALQFRGFCFASLDHREKAVLDLKHSLAISPTFPALLILAEQYIFQDRLDEAENLVQTVIYCRPQIQFLNQSKLLLAKIYQKKGNIPQAQNCLEEIILEDPSHHRALLELGNLFRQIHQPQKAEFYFRRALAVIIEVEQNVDVDRYGPVKKMLRTNRQMATSALDSLTNSD